MSAHHFGGGSSPCKPAGRWWRKPEKSEDLLPPTGEWLPCSAGNKRKKGKIQARETKDMTFKRERPIIGFPIFHCRNRKFK